jgi:hypothetical protein
MTRLRILELPSCDQHFQDTTTNVRDSDHFSGQLVDVQKGRQADILIMDSQKYSYVRLHGKAGRRGSSGTVASLSCSCMRQEHPCVVKEVLALKHHRNPGRASVLWNLCSPATPKDAVELMAVESDGSSNEGAGAPAKGGGSDEDVVAPESDGRRDVRMSAQESDGRRDVRMGAQEAAVDQKQLGVSLQASALVACWHASAAMRWLFAV